QAAPPSDPSPPTPIRYAPVPVLALQQQQVLLACLQYLEVAHQGRMNTTELAQRLEQWRSQLDSQLQQHWAQWQTKLSTTPPLTPAQQQAEPLAAALEQLLHQQLSSSFSLAS
ncbi:MAG: hypothetical protein KIG95_01345, partial [Comamonas sp.]|nr:hypothetical protein [Comamonas sp.]